MSNLSHSLATEVAVMSINQMLKSDFFSICSITDAAKILGVSVRNSHSYKVLNALHCMHYSDMTPKVRESIPQLIADTFIERSDVFQFPLPSEQEDRRSIIDVEVVTVGKVRPQSKKTRGFLDRMLGKD